MSTAQASILTSFRFFTHLSILYGLQHRNTLKASNSSGLVFPYLWKLLLLFRKFGASFNTMFCELYSQTRVIRFGSLWYDFGQPCQLGLKNTPTASHNVCSGHGIKLSDGEAPVIRELWRIPSTTTLPSLPDSLWPGVVTPDRVNLWVK